jgi:ribonuclease Z
LKVVFLGTGGSGGPPGRAHNCILVESQRARIVLDFGESCSWRLHELGLTLCDVDGVFVSHVHADHYVGLFDAVVYSASMGCHSLRLLVPEPIADQVAEAVRSIVPRSLRSGLEARPVGFEGLVVGDVRLSIVESCHSIPCYGAILRGPEALIAYTADTRPCHSLYNAIKRFGVPDLVIHEAALPDNLASLAEEKGHSTPAQAAKALELLGGKGLMALVHLSDASLRQLARATQLPRRLLVPNDMAVVSL